MNYAKYFVISISIIMTLSSGNAFCFDNKETHQFITRESKSYSIINKYLIDTLGFNNGADEIIKESKIWFPESKSIIKWLQSGSYEEDRPTCRASTHFHNPLLTWDQSYVTDSPFTICPWPKNSAIYWATGNKTRNQTTPDIRYKQEMGWDNARSYFYLALTSTASINRDDYFTKSFRSIGQVLHLLQDMAVPAHVRNDFQSHLIFQGVTGTIFNLTDWFGNPFEHYVKTQGRGLIASAVPGVSDKPTFSDTRVNDFWDTTDTSGNSVGSGLAEITNRSYFSDSTIPGNSSPSSDKYYSVHQFNKPQLGTGMSDCLDVLPGSKERTRYVSRTSVPCPAPGSGKVDHFAAYSFRKGYRGQVSKNQIYGKL